MMTERIEKLVERQRAGEALDFLFFWGHRRRADGALSKSCFSQWYDQGFTHQDEYFRTAEHWMMAGKAALFKDEPARKRILAARDPLSAKKIGRQVKGFQQAEWEAANFDIVVEGNLLKFSQHNQLKSFLLNTGNRVLVEAAPDDFIWGIGMVEQDPRATDPTQWQGTNLLGFALMEVRSRLRQHAG